MRKTTKIVTVDRFVSINANVCTLTGGDLLIQLDTDNHYKLIGKLVLALIFSLISLKIENE